MCVHERITTPQFKTLEQQMKEHGFVALTLSGNGRDFSMFVNPREAICVKRAYTDLRNWHPGAQLSMQSLDRITSGENAAFSYNELCDLDSEGGLLVRGRNVPDSLDLDERNFQAVYDRCYQNGYFTKKAPALAAG